MPPQRNSTRPTINYIQFHPFSPPNIPYIRNLLLDPLRRSHFNNIIEQPEHAPIQTSIAEFDYHIRMLSAIHAEQNNLRRIIRNAEISARHAQKTLEAFTIHEDLVEHHRDNALAQALRRGAFGILRNIVEAEDTGNDSDGSMPLLIPNVDIRPSGSPENPILVEDDDDEPVPETSDVPTQTSPVSSSSSSQEADSSTPSINIQDFVQSLRERGRTFEVPRCSNCRNWGHSHHQCPIDTD